MDFGGAAEMLQMPLFAAILIAIVEVGSVALILLGGFNKDWMTRIGVTPASIITQLSHENGMRRMIEAGVTPITWNVVPAELQRDHARSATEPGITRVFLEHLFKMDPDTGWQ